MPGYLYGVLAVGWLAWALPFILFRRSGERAVIIDPRARWGIVLEGIGYALVWQGRFWERQPDAWRIAASILFFVMGALLSWSARSALGKQWRVDAGLNASHELVRSGAYRWVRHPIYASMLCTLMGMGLLLTPLWLLAIALVIFLIGTEIRVRTEDRLLASRFGTEFQSYRQAVPAYIPFVR